MRTKGELVDTGSLYRHGLEMKSFVWVLGFLVMSALGACGDDTSPDSGSDDADTRRDARGGGEDTGPGDACEGLGDNEGRCDGGATEACVRGRLIRRDCRAGFMCVEEDDDAQCQCDNAMDDECPRGCSDDPDCAGCTPMCTGLECGDNGCGGECGTCGGDEFCNDDGMCEVPTGLCSNECEYADDDECDDGGPDSITEICDYGTDCGDCGVREDLPVICTVNYNDDCPADQRCNCDEATGSCICAPGARGEGVLGDACDEQTDCATGLCLDAQCSRPCDNENPCEAPLAECQAFLGLCVPGSCETNCGGRTCGADGCGGTCGTCEGGDVCVSGQCEAEAGDALACPGSAGQCARGEACCITSPDGSRSRCFEHDTSRDALCRTSAEDDGTYGYLGCNGDEDCGGSRVCCGGNSTTFCADSCDAPNGAVCDTETSDCGGAAGLRCCPLSTPLWFDGDYGLGRCLPSSCP